jgi:hypothetical protein
MNTYLNPNISRAGGLTNFTAALSPSNTVAQSSQLDWSNVFLNGASCAKVPSQSLLLEDCAALQ